MRIESLSLPVFSVSPEAVRSFTAEDEDLQLLHQFAVHQAFKAIKSPVNWSYWAKRQSEASERDVWHVCRAVELRQLVSSRRGTSCSSQPEAQDGRWQALS